MSTLKRAALHNSIVQNLRYLIAGSILFNQKVADRVGLRLTDMQCLNVLELLGPATPGKLAECTGLTTGGVTVMLDRLEKAGLIQRVPNPGDRRSILVHINPRKMKKVHPMYAEINRQMEELLAATPQSELEAVVDFLARMNAIRVDRMNKKPAKN